MKKDSLKMNIMKITKNLMVRQLIQQKNRLIIILDDKIDDDDDDARVNKAKSRAAAAAAIKLTREIMTKLACDLNGTDSNNL